MFYWIIVLSFTFVGTAIAWKTLTHLWNKYDPITLRALPMLRAGHSMPGDPNYLDLKFSLARHAFMFLVTATIMYWVQSPLIRIIFLLGGYAFYTATLISRYQYRKDIINNLAASEESKALAEMLTKPFKDSKVVVVYSVCAELVLFVLHILTA